MPRTKTFVREEILEKAMELFWKKGFHGTSMQDLVDHLGINRASLYATYGDKYQLFLETLTQYRKEQIHMLNKLLKQPEDIIKFLEDFLVQQNVDGSCSKDGCFIVNTSIDMAPHDEKVNKLVVGNMISFEQKFEAFFELAQQNGLISNKNSPRTLARFLYTSSVGLRVLARTVNDPEVIREIAKTTVQVFYRNT